MSTNLGPLFDRGHVLGPITVHDTAEPIYNGMVAEFGLPWYAIGPGPVVPPEQPAPGPLVGRVLDPTETGPLTLATLVGEP